EGPFTNGGRVARGQGAPVPRAWHGEGGAGILPRIEPSGPRCGLLRPTGSAPGTASDWNWLPNPVWYEMAASGAATFFRDGSSWVGCAMEVLRTFLPIGGCSLRPA